MARWEPNTRERLEQAALELYFTQGYEQTTIGDISARVGVTSRTYFRYFPDKREVLFGGAELLQETIVAAVAEASTIASPFDAALAGFAAAESVFRPREFVQRREAVIATSEELQEREVMKLASIAKAVASRLRERGDDPATARMAASAALATHLEATRSWLDGSDVPFAELLADSARRMKSIVGS